MILPLPRNRARRGAAGLQLTTKTRFVEFFSARSQREGNPIDSGSSVFTIPKRTPKPCGESWQSGRGFSRLAHEGAPE